MPQPSSKVGPPGLTSGQTARLGRSDRESDLKKPAQLLPEKQSKPRCGVPVKHPKEITPRRLCSEYNNSEDGHSNTVVFTLFPVLCYELYIHRLI